VIIYLSLLVSILGLLVFVLASNASEAGRLAFAVALLAFLLRISELPTIRNG
jgi:hypothetical protein